MCAQVLVSIQSMILVEDPYHNEPGYEHSRATPQGASASARYNASIRHYTAQHAILDALQKPNAAFADVIRCRLLCCTSNSGSPACPPCLKVPGSLSCREHFKHKKEQVLAQCSAWLPRHDATLVGIAAALQKL